MIIVTIYNKRKARESIYNFYEDRLEYILDNINDNYDEYSIKIKKIKDVEKLDSGLYEVKAQIETKTEDKYGDEEINTNTTIFIIYNNKVVSMN